MFSVLFPALIACNEQPNEPPVTTPVDEECEDIERQQIEDETVLSVVDSNDAFALDIYEQLRTDKVNVFLSPYSISTALGMLHLGAEGNTETEMSNVLGVFADEADWHQGQGALVQEFELGDNCDYKLAVANKAYAQIGYNFQPEFVDGLGSYYNSEVGELDFFSDPEAARGTINGWVSDQTNDRIPELFPANTITSDTKLVLTNAIYMDAPWKDSFDPENTYPGQFTLADGSSTEVDMMYRSEMPYSISYQDGFRVVEIAYEGEELAFTAIVPDEVDGLDAIEAQLSPENLAAWKSNLYSTEGELSMPTFEMRYKELLNSTLQTLGMNDAFVPGTADFTGISEQSQLNVDIVIHEAWLKVSEEGTEAAAATGVSVTDASAGEYVYLNRPFLFLIEDKLSGSILFMGKLADPSLL